MIYCVTSSSCIISIQRVFINKLKSVDVIYLVYDNEYSRTESISNIEYQNTFRFIEGEKMESFILERWSKGDMLISFDSFYIYSTKLIEIMGGFCANFHPSLLPSYKGVNPISWGLYNSESKWGVSWHVIDKNIDAGKIIIQKEFDINENMSQFQIMTFCLMIGLKLIPNVLASLSMMNTDFPIYTTRNKSYYRGTDTPRFVIKGLSDANFFQRIAPFNRERAWRWAATVEGKEVTALSQANNFGALTLKKKIIIEGYTFFYATTKL